MGIDEQMAGQIKALLSSLLPCALPVVDPEEFLGRGYAHGYHKSKTQL